MRLTRIILFPSRSGQLILGSSPRKRQDLTASPIPQNNMRKPTAEGMARGDRALSTPTLIIDDAYRMKSPSRARKQPTAMSAGLSVFTTTSEYWGSSGYSAKGPRCQKTFSAEGRSPVYPQHLHQYRFSMEYRESPQPLRSGPRGMEDIERALAQAGGKITRAAEALGVHHTTLWRKCKRLSQAKNR